MTQREWSIQTTWLGSSETAFWGQRNTLTGTCEDALRFATAADAFATADDLRSLELINDFTVVDGKSCRAGVRERPASS